MLNHARNNFEGYTFAMRTLEAWGAMIENDHRAYYTAGGRVWVHGSGALRRQEDRGCLAPEPGRSKLPLRRILLIDDTPEIAELLTFCAA